MGMAALSEMQLHLTTAEGTCFQGKPVPSWVNEGLESPLLAIPDKVNKLEGQTAPSKVMRATRGLRCS